MTSPEWIKWLNGKITDVTIEHQVRQSLFQNKVPIHLHDETVRYLLWGEKPKGFLAGVVDDDLYRTVLTADEKAKLHLTEIIKWFHNYAPMGAYGRTRDPKASAYYTWSEQLQKCGKLVQSEVDQ